MKSALKMICLLLIVVASGCKKEDEDEGLLPSIAFKTGAGYISKDSTLTVSTTFTIGVTANKTEDEDYLKKFIISKKTGAAASTTIYSKDLTDAEKNSFGYDFNTSADSLVSNTEYTFSIVNRDGLLNSVALKIQTQ